MLFWILQLCALPWSLISLAKGFEADFADPRVERLHKYDHLLVRLLSSMIASPWFGVPTWIFALYPWLPLYHHWRFHNLTKQLIFAKPQVEVAFRSFLSGFELYVSWTREFCRNFGCQAFFSPSYVWDRIRVLFHLFHLVSSLVHYRIFKKRSTDLFIFSSWWLSSVVMPFMQHQRCCLSTFPSFWLTPLAMSQRKSVSFRHIDFYCWLHIRIYEYTWIY